MKRKKMLSLFLAACIITTTALIGCGKSSNDIAAPNNETATEDDTIKSTDKTLTLMHYFDPNDTQDSYSVGFMKLIEGFTAETGIKVNLETVPWNEIESKLVMTNQSGNPTCDISWVSSQKLASLVNAGALLPLDDYYKDLDTSDFIDQAIDAATFPGDGKKYLVEASVHSRGLWYNTDLIQTPPANWNELIDAAVSANAQDNNIYGFAAYTPKTYDPCELYLGPFTWSAGGQLANEDGSAAWDNEATKESIQLVSDLKNKHKVMPASCFTSDRAEILETFLNGKIAMLLEGTFAYAPIMESELGQSGKIKFAPIPGKNGPAPCFTNGWSMGIPSNSKQPDLAWEFIKYMVKPEVQIEHSKFDGGLPILNASYNDDFFKTNQYPEIVDNLKNNSGTMDPFVYYQEALESLSTVNMSYAIDPTQDLEKMLTDSAQDFNKKYYND